MTTATTDDSATPAAANDGGDRGRLAAVGDGAAEAYRAARERTVSAYEAARGTARSAGRKTVEGVEANPVAAVVGGLALGALAAALLPKTKREQAMLGDVGRRINDTAREAARAAREAGKEQIGELGFSGDAVRRRLDGLTDAAVGALREKVRGKNPE
jgi:histone H3/H4